MWKLISLGWTLIVVGTAMAVLGIKLRMKNDQRFVQDFAADPA
jgi:hypothetical protein